jgi:hypothetical protein
MMKRYLYIDDVLEEASAAGYQMLPKKFKLCTYVMYVCMKMYNTTLLKILPASGKLGFISPARSLT